MVHFPKRGIDLPKRGLPLNSTVRRILHVFCLGLGNGISLDYCSNIGLHCSIRGPRGMIRCRFGSNYQTYLLNSGLWIFSSLQVIPWVYFWKRIFPSQSLGYVSWEGFWSYQTFVKALLRKLISNFMILFTLNVLIMLAYLSNVIDVIDMAIWLPTII